MLETEVKARLFDVLMEKIEARAAKSNDFVDWDGEGEVPCIDDYAGGNMDDAYAVGFEAGSIDMCRDLAYTVQETKHIIEAESA